MNFKTFSTFLLSVLFIGFFSFPVLATSESQFTINSTTAIINGNSVTMEVAPYIKDGRTFMPLAYVAQAIGVNNINWDPGSQTVNMMNDTNVVQVQVVKTTTGGAGTPFNMSANEVAFSEKYASNYYLVRVYGYNKTTNGGMFYAQKGYIGDLFEMEPVQFRVRR